MGAFRTDSHDVVTNTCQEHTFLANIVAQHLLTIEISQRHTLGQIGTGIVSCMCGHDKYPL